MSDSDGIVEIIELPSRGLLYGEALPDGKVELRPMKTSDEKLLAGGGANRIALIDTLIKRCLKTDAVPYNKLLSGDKTFLLFALRSISYGTYYEFKLACSSCSEQFIHGMDVPSDFEIRVLTEEDEEFFSVELPMKKKTVVLRRLLVEDEAGIVKFLKREKIRSGRKAEGDPAYQMRMALSIVSIDDEEVKLKDAIDFVEDLYGKDSLAIRNSIEDNDCGVDIMLNLDCPHCGNPIETMMPFTTEFFRPKSS